MKKVTLEKEHLEELIYNAFLEGSEIDDATWKRRQTKLETRMQGKTVKSFFEESSTITRMKKLTEGL